CGSVLRGMAAGGTGVADGLVAALRAFGLVHASVLTFRTANDQVILYHPLMDQIHLPRQPPSTTARAIPRHTNGSRSDRDAEPLSRAAHLFIDHLEDVLVSPAQPP